MDIEPWVVGLVAFVVVTVIVTVVSMFSIRETPFEEAMGSKRRELGLDLALDPTLSGKDGKKQKSQKDKNKDKSSKKVKNADTVKAVKTKNSSEQQEEKRRNSEEEKRRNSEEEKRRNSEEEETKRKITTDVKAQQQPSIEITQVPIPVVEVKPTQVSSKSQKSETKKHDRIDFKIANEVVTLNEEEDQKLSERRVSRDDRPRKPILIKKPGGHVEAEHADESKAVRGNSFETVHPKDEFELVKSKQKQSEVVDGQVNGHGHGHGHGPDQAANVSVQTNKKHKKGQNAAESVQVVTSKQLIEMVKNLVLSDEEVQLVVNELLNKESADSGGANWSSKNDPVAHLKKSLAEKEQALAMESCNLEAAQARLRELRQEFANEKTRNASMHQTAERFRLEVQRQQLLIQQLTERHDVEVKALQSSLQSKLNEERNLVLAREEIKRLKDMIKKLESERSTLDSIPRLKHEIDQLVNERSQSERTISSLKNSADESQRRAVMLDEHLQKLLSDRKQEESARDVQVKELRNQIEASESKVHSLLQELNSLQNSKREEEEGRRIQSEQRMKQLESQIHSLESQIHSLESQIRSLESENGTLKASLSKNGAESSHQLNELNRVQEELRNEIQSKNEAMNRLQKELEEEKSSRSNSDSEKESRLNAVMDDLNRISSEKEQVSKTVSELETQRNQLSCERDEVLNILRPLHLDGDSNNLVSLVKCLADQPKGVPGVDVEQLEKEKQALSEQVQQFKQTILEKEEAIKEIENKSKEDVRSWEEKWKELTSEKETLERDRDRLSGEKKSLENTLKDLEGLQSTVVEMEEKLRDLQSKLESEELTKKELSVKYDEVRIEPEEEASSDLAKLREEVEVERRELEEVAEEKERLARLKEEIDASVERVEQEKKSVKEVQVQNVRLKSLVKIGEDSLRAEQERVRQLEQLLKVKNGSVSNADNVVTSNGDGSPTTNNTSSNTLNQEPLS